MSDIPPKRLALEIDRVHSLVSELYGLLERLPGSADGHDPPSIRDDRSVLQLLGPRVEDVDALGNVGGIDGDVFPLGVASRVAPASEDDADGVFPLLNVNVDGIQPPLRTGEHDLGQVTRRKQDERLGLGVSETDVVFQDFRTGRSEHEAGKEHAQERVSFFPHPPQGGFEAFRGDPTHDLFVPDRSWGVGSHPASVQPDVSFAYPLVVLCGRKTLERVSIAKGQDADLGASEEFLDDDLLPRVSEFHVDEDGLDGGPGFVHGLRDEYSLSTSESGSFDDDSRVSAGVQVGERVLVSRRGETGESGRGDRVTGHEGFGEGFRTLEQGGSRGWTEDGDAG